MGYKVYRISTEEACWRISSASKKPINNWYLKQFWPDIYDSIQLWLLRFKDLKIFIVLKFHSRNCRWRKSAEQTNRNFSSALEYCWQAYHRAYTLQSLQPITITLIPSHDIFTSTSLLFSLALLYVYYIRLLSIAWTFSQHFDRTLQRLSIYMICSYWHYWIIKLLIDIWWLSKIETTFNKKFLPNFYASIFALLKYLDFNQS